MNSNISFGTDVGIDVKNVTESGENAVSADTTKLKSDKCHSPCDALKYNDADGSFTSNLNWTIWFSNFFDLKIRIMFILNFYICKHGW